MQTCWLLLLLAPAMAQPLSTITIPDYDQTNLVSNIRSNAPVSDLRLVNPWGIVADRYGVWVNDNASGLTTFYGPHGAPSRSCIHIPAPGGGIGTPTGLAVNKTAQFVISNGARQAPSTLLMATEDGTIAAWNSSVSGSNAVIVVDNSASGAVYKGLDIAGLTNDFISVFASLYAANFHAGTVDVFDGSFRFMFAFNDPDLPEHYAPFNVRVIRGRVFVTFALQKLPDAHDDQAGAGNGYVDIFDLDGSLLRRFASQGPLNSPWGMAIAPKHFGRFSHALLVGNAGDGIINAYDLLTGKLLGALTAGFGTELVIDGLWGLAFDHDEIAGHESDFRADRLYFTSGLKQPAAGLLGFLRPVSPDTPTAY
jgi:uncharacterized protein (TIGR03118 family)